MTKSSNGEATLMFDSVVVRDSNNSKEFREVPIEVTAKEIYVGSNYKIKWKHVTSLQCKNDLDEDESSSKTLQDYRDEDYERAGFELACVLDSKKNKQEEHRTVLVQFPVPPDGQRIVAHFWETFGRALEGGYKKEMRKRQKKLDKEQQKMEEELQEQQIRRKEFSRKTSSRSYSKRPYDFLRKNAANLAHNAEQWTDDEEEAPLAPQVVPKAAAAEEEDVAAASGDESEQEFQDDFGNANVKSESESIDGNSVAVEDDKEDAMDENDDDDDSVTNVAARNPRSSNKRRIKRRGPVLDDSEDEEDDLFQNTAEMTQPMSQRVVTPKHNAQKFLDDDDQNNVEVAQKKAEETDEEEEEEEEESVHDNKKINSFFQPRPKIKSAPKDKNSDAPKPRDFQPKSSFFAPKSKPPKTKTPILSPKRMKKIKTSGTKNILDNDNSDSDDEATTVVASETKDSSTPSTPFLRAHSPKQKKSPFGIINAAESKIDRINIEEEDPIEESSQSQSPLKATSSLSKRGRFSSNRLTSIKRRRLKINESRSALEALEFADARAHHLRSPISANRKNASNAAIGTTGERSPIQPLKLGPQVEEMAVSTQKWRGLRNDGNSCYVNSSLQQLFSVPNFMQALSKRQEGHELTASLFQLYENLLQNGNSRCASAKPVKRVVDKLTNRFHGYQQRDAHEFLGEVMDQIHEELSKDSESKSKQDPTDDFFRWNVQVCLQCKSCGYSRSKEEMYRYLSIDIGQDVKPAVDSCLAKFFAPEDREVNCEKCQEGKIATQTMKILSVPKVILLHLKRFMVVEKPGAAEETTELVIKKNKVPVELTTTLSVDKLCNQSSDKVPLDDYRLKSIVHHIGNTANSGHYTTDALRPDPEEKVDRWVSFDDGVVAENNLDKIVKTPKHQKTAYMLLYSRD